MKNNNGKMILAIVAMVVVALSIVGVTYAYFVAQVQGQGATDVRVVDVQAGTLKIAYAGGTTLTAKNIVPGWISDNDKYYDPIHSVTTGEDGKTHITAASVEALTAAQKTITSVENGATAPVGPVTFTVTNNSENGATAYYGIRLVEVTNQIAELTNAEEKDDFHVTISTVTGDGLTEAVEVTGELIEDYPLTAERIQNASGVISISGEDTVNKFQVSAEYQETTKEQTGTGKTVKFDVEVVGLNLVDGKYVDYQGTEWE